MDGDGRPFLTWRLEPVPPTHESIIRANATHYGRLYREHGDTPEAAQWSDVASQDRRLHILCELADLHDAKILDFGCGTGRLYQLLVARGFSGSYVGYDIASEVVEVARSKFSAARFECRNILTQGINEEFDYAVASGVFNNRHCQSEQYVRDILVALFRSTRKGLGFNALSTYVDYVNPELNYLDPMVMFSFCKTDLSSSVVLRHDYLLKDTVIPYEFTLYAYKTGLPRPANIIARSL